MAADFAALLSTFAQPGTVQWIGVRPARHATVRVLEEADVTMAGLTGDRRETPGRRAVTLLQWEHLPVIAAVAGRDRVDPSVLRRNIAVSGLNLLALRKVRFRVGKAVLQGTGPCAPCSRMHDALGPGGYNAMRGHGGITAEVIEPGSLALGDALSPLPEGGQTC